MSPLDPKKDSQAQIMLDQLLLWPQQPGNDSAEPRYDIISHLPCSFTEEEIRDRMFADLLLSPLTPTMSVLGLQEVKLSPVYMGGGGSTFSAAKSLPPESGQLV